MFDSHNVWVVIQLLSVMNVVLMADKCSVLFGVKGRKGVSGCLHM